MGGTIKDENTRFLITISKTLKERASFIAKCEHRSLNNLIIAALSAYVDQHYPLYESIFEQDGTSKNNINPDELANITNRMFVLGAAGSGKSAMLDHLLKNMYFNEFYKKEEDDKKSDTD